MGCFAQIVSYTVMSCLQYPALPQPLQRSFDLWDGASWSVFTIVRKMQGGSMDFSWSLRPLCAVQMQLQPWWSDSLEIGSVVLVLLPQNYFGSREPGYYYGSPIYTDLWHSLNTTLAYHERLMDATWEKIQSWDNHLHENAIDEDKVENIMRTVLARICHMHYTNDARYLSMYDTLELKRLKYMHQSNVHFY